MPTDKARAIGQRLRQAREDKGWDKTGAAEMVGTKPPVWKRYEDAEADPPLSFLVRVSDVFQKPVAWFFQDIDDAMLREQLGGLDPLLVSVMAKQPATIQRAVARTLPLVRDICREEGLPLGN